MRRLQLLVPIIILTTISLCGQNSLDTNSTVQLFGLRLHQGSVLIHSRHLRPIEDSYPIGLELDLAWHKTSKSAWESCLCYPKIGVATTFWDYDNPDILGQGVTSMFYIEPVFGALNWISFSVRAGFGLSYQNRPYNAQNNPFNLSYSTHIAFPLQLGGNAHFRIAPKWMLDATFVYNHFSNGGIKEPNKGINWPSVALGFGYYLEPPKFNKWTKKNWRENGDPDIRLDIAIFSAVHEPETKVFVFSPGLEVKYSRQFSRINAFTLGGEWMYDNKAKHKMERFGIQRDPQKASLALGHEFLMGKFLFSQQIGYYLYKPHREGDNLYQRYGLIFQANPKISFGINLKAHRHVADFVDFRVGWSWLKTRT